MRSRSASPTLRFLPETQNDMTASSIRRRTIAWIALFYAAHSAVNFSPVAAASQPHDSS
jgi:hypothetical protein